MEEPQDEPLQLIELVRDEAGAATTIHLREDTIGRVFQKIGDLPISVMCVCGPSRQGKSFLLGYIIRCLEGLEKDEDDWMDWEDMKKPLKGFKFRNGTSPEGQGIWVWSRPFIVKNEEGKEVAVLLVDTQGTYDEFTTNKDMSAIVGLSMLTSSVMIFNFFNNLQEEILSALSIYVQYGSLALDKGQGSGAPFQKLLFLIRDWNNPGQFGYGEKGGKLFLEEKLKIKEGQPPEAKHFRETIRKCFKDLDCYLMPSIGEKALYPEFTGSIDELAVKFAKELEKFINGLISSENLTVKEIMGSPVTASGLRSCLETYVEIFNSDETPSAEKMWQATALMSNNNEVEKALKKHQHYIKKRMWGNSYLPNEDLDKAHATGRKQAMELFKKAKKFGTQGTISEFEEKLEDKIKAEFSNIKKQNEDKRRKFIAAATTYATNDFRAQLDEKFPLEGNSEFYEENKIERDSEQIKTVVMQEFKEMLSNESEKNLATLVQSVEEIFATILNYLINKNKATRGNAETKMNLIVQGFSSSHRSQLQEYFASNEFEEDEATLQKSNKKIMSVIVGLFEQRSKPGKEDFHKEYLVKLETELKDNFFTFKNYHIQDVMIKKEVKKTIKGFHDQYMIDLREVAEENDMDEGKLNELHLRKESYILEEFHQVNPFPRGSPQSNELEAKVKEQLKQVFEQIKVKTVLSGYRSAESYQKATDHALEYYKREMKEIVDSDELIADEDLEMEHERILEEAMNQYENFNKIGVPDDALEIKYDLRNTLIVDEWNRIRKDCETRRDLLKSRAENGLSECEKEYNRVMKIEVDNVRTLEELVERHEKARAASLAQLFGSCPMRDPAIIKEYEDRLSEIIDERFEEAKVQRQIRAIKEEVKRQQKIRQTIGQQKDDPMEVDDDEEAKAAERILQKKSQAVQEKIRLRRQQEEQLQQERQQKHDAMRKLASNAVMQLKGMMPVTTEKWLSEQLYPRNVTEIKSVYGHLLNGVVAEARKYIDASLWKDCESIINAECGKDCIAYLDTIQQRIEKFFTPIKRKFDYYGCLQKNELEKLGSDELGKVTKDLLPDNFVIHQLVETGCVKLMNCFRADNEKIIHNEEFLAENLIPDVLNFYDDEMTRFLRENIYNPNRLKDIHKTLVGRLVEVFKTAFKFSSRNNKCEHFEGKLDALRERLGEKFAHHLKKNNENSKRMEAEVTKLLKTHKESYVEKIEDVLTKNSDGLEIRELTKKNDEIVNETRKLLQMEIKQKIRQDEPVNVHLKTLQAQIDNYWKCVLDMKNLRKMKERGEQERKGTVEEKRLERKREELAVLYTKPKEILTLGVNGDPYLGGVDFDKKIVRYCAACFKTEFGLDLFAGKDSAVKQERDEARRRLRRLQTYCEMSKRVSSTSTKSIRIRMDAIMNGLDLTVDVAIGSLRS